MLKTQQMNPDIIEANYNQKPIDVTGRLYSESPPTRRSKRLTQEVELHRLNPDGVSGGSIL